MPFGCNHEREEDKQVKLDPAQGEQQAGRKAFFLPQKIRGSGQAQQKQRKVLAKGETDPERKIPAAQQHRGQPRRPQDEETRHRRDVHQLPQGVGLRIRQPSERPK